MHELGIMTGVLESAEEAAKNAGADKVLKISLSVGVMTEAIEDVLRFAFDALSEGTIFEGCVLEITMIQPVSICLDCGNECGSPFLQLIQGKELRIDSIEVDVPDKDELSPSNANAEQEA